MAAGSARQHPELSRGVPGRLRMSAICSSATRVLRHGLANGAIPFVNPAPDSLLENTGAFRTAAAAVVAVSRTVVARVRPALGGLTAEQHRVLEGWRARM